MQTERTHRAWPTAGMLALLGALLPLVAVGADGATARWSGRNGGFWVELYTDGQKAAGGMQATLPRGYAELELSGTRSGSRYTGTARGAVRKQGSLAPVNGSWTATVPNGRIDLQLSLPQAALPAVSVPLQAGEIQALQCSWLRGTATRTPAGKQGIALQSGAKIEKGDTVETAAGSAAIIVLGDRSVMVMEEKTRVQVPDTADNEHAIQKVKATAGKIWFAVKKVQQGSKFEVETDEAVAAVRGTEFIVEVDPTGLSLSTTEGEVACTDLARKQTPYVVSAGRRWRLRRDIVAQRQAWESSSALDVAPLVQQWRPLLDEADRHWPFRRYRKAAFWQDNVGAGNPGGVNRGGPGRRGGGANGMRRGGGFGRRRR